MAKDTTAHSDIDPTRFNIDDVRFGTPHEYAAFLKKYEEWY